MQHFSCVAFQPTAEGWVVFGRGSAGGFYVGYKKGRPQTAVTIVFLRLRICLG